MEQEPYNTPAAEIHEARTCQGILTAFSQLVSNTWGVSGTLRSEAFCGDGGMRSGKFLHVQYSSMIVFRAQTQPEA